MARDALLPSPKPWSGVAPGIGSRLELEEPPSPPFLSCLQPSPVRPALLPSEPRAPTWDLDLQRGWGASGERRRALPAEGQSLGQGVCLTVAWGLRVSPWFSPHNSITFEVEEPSREACVEAQTWKASLSRGSYGQTGSPHPPNNTHSHSHIVTDSNTLWTLPSSLQ